MDLLPLEVLRRTEEVEDMDVAVRNALGAENVDRAKLLRLRSEAVALLHRLENDLP